MILKHAAVTVSVIIGTAAAVFSAGCAFAEEAAPPKIITTIFPEYDWTRNILGENMDAELKLLLDNGADLHSYQPTADDILAISTCDMFVYVGGESDRWVDDALKEASNKDMVVINLLDVLGSQAQEEEIVEGMQTEEEHEEGGEEEEAEYDEHVWLSLKNAALFVDAIADALSGIDETNAQVYRDNADAYKEKLGELDAQYQEAVDSAAGKILLFGDRFPFRYLTEDYGLEYYAAFSGCSAETEASFDTVIFLAGKVDELSLPSVMTIEGTDHRIADTIIQATKNRNQTILTLDSMQSTTGEDIKNGVTYLSVMEKNLEVLKEALQSGK